MEYSFDPTPTKTSTGADFIYVFGLVLAVMPILVVYQFNPTGLEEMTPIQVALLSITGFKGCLLALIGYLRSRQIRKEARWYGTPLRLSSGDYYASAVVKNTY